MSFISRLWNGLHEDDVIIMLIGSAICALLVVLSILFEETMEGKIVLSLGWGFGCLVFLKVAFHACPREPSG